MRGEKLAYEACQHTKSEAAYSSARPPNCTLGREKLFNSPISPFNFPAYHAIDYSDK